MDTLAMKVRQEVKEIVKIKIFGTFVFVSRLAQDSLQNILDLLIIT